MSTLHTPHSKHFLRLHYKKPYSRYFKQLKNGIFSIHACMYNVCVFYSFYAYKTSVYETNKRNLAFYVFLTYVFITLCYQ